MIVKPIAAPFRKITGSTRGLSFLKSRHRGKRKAGSLIEPVGRVYFVGAYADNLNWGQEAGTRSANRIADAIDNT